MTPQDVARKLRDSLGLSGLPLLRPGHRAGLRMGVPHFDISDLEIRTRSRAGREAFGVIARAEGMFGFRESGGRSARSTGTVMGSDPNVAGGLARHVPVLVHSVIEQLGVRDGGVYVGQQPHLLHFKDTDGDDHADEWRVVLTGFGREDTHELLNSFRIHHRSHPYDHVHQIHPFHQYLAYHWNLELELLVQLRSKQQ